MKLKDIKTYVLLENGKIKNAYYDKEKTELRNFECRGWGRIYLNYDEFRANGIYYISAKVLATSDSISELIEKLKEKNND